jgi:hypothetical protein
MVPESDSTINQVLLCFLESLDSWFGPIYVEILRLNEKIRDFVHF